ncbi:hypothetical protein [Lysinibacillus xylanilyticus]|uniref:hypothetical protein n=1 Tax=Lysinibacillus xylanilyticus TaxID=582475 RepID=UPI0038170A24
MNLFYVRIVFFVDKTYDFDLDEEITLFNDKNVVCKVIINRRDEFEGSKVIITYGGFKGKEIAEYEGKKLFYSVKKKFITAGIPINISGGLGVLDTTQTAFSNGGLTEFGLKNIHLFFPLLANEVVRNEILGMGIYEFDQNIDISEVKFISQDARISLKRKFPELEIAEYPQDKKLDIAYSLLNSSNVINDLRTSFLLKVSTIESLVSDDAYNDNVYCDMISKINKLITIDNVGNDADLPEEEYVKTLQKIKSSIGLLKKKSINIKCIDLINSYNFNSKYKNLEAAAFFNKCYKLRSEFVHTGTYENTLTEEQKIRNLEEYNMELQKLVVDVLECYEVDILKRK